MSGSVSVVDPSSRRLRLRNAIAGHVTHLPGSQIGPRRQKQIQMLLIHAGHMTVSIDGRTPYTVHAGEMCILLPSHTEEITFGGAEGTRQTLVRGDPEELAGDMRGWLESLRPTRPLSAALTYLAREAVASEQTRLTAQGALVDALATSLLWRFIAEFENLPAALPAAIERARLFIHRNLTAEIDLASIATAAHVSSEHLVRLFRTHLGTTPIRYMWERRVTQGIELLTSTGLPVGLIAERSGFKTSFHFSRKIRDATGMSPSVLRATNWNEPTVG